MAPLSIHAPPPQYMEKVMEKELSETDTKCRLAFPTAQVHQVLLSNDHNDLGGVDFEAVDTAGKSYPLRLTVRKQGYRKPEITGGWLHFIRSKNLKPHDKVLFYKRHANGAPPTGQSRLCFTVTSKRAVRVFGAVLGYTAEE